MLNPMLKHFVKSCSLAACMILLAGCGSLYESIFEKDNTPKPTPLTTFNAEVTPKRLWGQQAGAGAKKENLKLGLALGETAIFTSSADGTVTAAEKTTGHILWQVDTDASLTTAPSYGQGHVIVGSRKGHVIALNASNGKILWRKGMGSEILAAPAISANAAIVKTVDGHVNALSLQQGDTLWHFQQIEPALILHGASAPQVGPGYVITGFANGNLIKLSLTSGQIAWQQTIAIAQGAFAIQRMIDIDADPLLFNHHIYAATYQGRIASLDWDSGKVLWTHDISSYTGMIADELTVYISDAESNLWAFKRENGLVNWRQTELQYRNITSPVLMGNYVVVGDNEGYLHWLAKQDGHLAARVSVSSGFVAAPVVENNVLYAITKNGYLVAYTLS